MQDILPTYRKVIRMSGKAGVNGKCTQKAECIHKGYSEHTMLVGEHMERSGTKKNQGKGFI